MSQTQPSRNEQARRQDAQNLITELEKIIRFANGIPGTADPNAKANLLSRCKEIIDKCNTILQIVVSARTSEQNLLSQQWIIFKEQWGLQRYRGSEGILIVCIRHLRAISEGA